MIFKILGSIWVFAACSLIGIYKAGELTKRVNVLSKIEESLLILENEIGTSLTPLPDAMRKAAISDISGIFLFAAKEMETKDAMESFKDAVSRANLCKEEEDTLLGFAMGLSAEDKEGQLKNIVLCNKRINKIKTEAAEIKKRLQKVYVSSGVLSGAAVVILLI